MESNDSPEIPDKGETSDIPGNGRVVMCSSGYIRRLQTSNFPALRHFKSAVKDEIILSVSFMILNIIVVIVWTIHVWVVYGLRKNDNKNFKKSCLSAIYRGLLGETTHVTAY